MVFGKTAHLTHGDVMAALIHALLAWFWVACADHCVGVSPPGVVLGVGQLQLADPFFSFEFSA